ncbi:MAG: hypothetical protein MI923_15260 [Phycisphaerales bacterium]|nr:hypothetical protein [Phycisphaerales bacterium]
MNGLRALICVFGIALGILSVGCSGPRKFVPDVHPDELSDDGFYAYLTEIPLVTVDEAYRAMLILADGEDRSEDFVDRQRKLETRGIAKSAWDLQQDHVVDTGSVAYMVCRICQIDGGVNMRLFGSLGLGDRRYALRELIYREMLEEAVDFEYMTGANLFALLRKADAHMAEKGLYESNVDLSDETDRDEAGELIVPPSVGQAPVEGA